MSEKIFYNILENDNFKIYGLYKPEEGNFKRLPYELAESISQGVKSMSRCPSGGRIRFKTDSEGISMKCFFPAVGESHCTSRICYSGFDLVIDGEYHGSYIPTKDENGVYCKYKDGKFGFEAGIGLKTRKLRDVIIYFPILTEVTELYIGIDEDALLLPGDEYENKKPVLYYGSSITHGMAASRSANTYPSMISKMLDTDYINLGFAGSCLAELPLADFMGGIEHSVFVYDYDHNSPTTEHLKNTHEKFFLEYRKKKPLTPVIMVSMADKRFIDTVEDRKNVIYTTYKNALAGGDKNVYFIDGQEIYKDIGFHYCTADGLHPNDLGYYLMAAKIAKVIDQIINK